MESNDRTILFVVEHSAAAETESGWVLRFRKRVVTKLKRVPFAFRCALGVAVLLSFSYTSEGAILFSYDSTGGQFPTDQGWTAFEVDTAGPLTGASAAGAITGTAANNSNAAIEVVDGINTLHIRDTLTDATADLPTFFYPWTALQRQSLIDNGLKLTVVAQVLTNTASNSNVRIGFNGTEFETQFDNIDADRTVQYQSFGAAAFPIDGAFHALVIAGQKNGVNFDFTLAIDGGAPAALPNVTNPALATFESTPYFGALSSAGRNSDILIRSVVMETVPEPNALILIVLGVMGIAAASVRRRQPNFSIALAG